MMSMPPRLWSFESRAGDISKTGFGSFGDCRGGLKPCGLFVNKAGILFLLLPDQDGVDSGYRRTSISGTKKSTDNLDTFSR
jgi:hypothetical protein